MNYSYKTSFKAIVSLHKTLIKPFDSYGFVLLYDAFKTFLDLLRFSYLDRNVIGFIKISSFVLCRLTKVLWVLNGARVSE